MRRLLGGYGCKDNEVPWGEFATVRWIDATCRLIIDRLIAVASYLPVEQATDHAEDPEPPTRRSRLNDAISALGHITATMDDGKSFLCPMRGNMGEAASGSDHWEGQLPWIYPMV